MSAVHIKQTEDGKLQFVQSDGAVLMELGRGSTDTDITFIRLYNADGESAYVYPNATQDGITVSGSAP